MRQNQTIDSVKGKAAVDCSAGIDTMNVETLLAEGGNINDGALPFIVNITFQSVTYKNEFWKLCFSPKKSFLLFLFSFQLFKQC